jgi:hypothetical protein
MFLLPFFGQEIDDRCMAAEKEFAIAPDGVGCVRFGDFLGISFEMAGQSWNSICE